MKTAVIVDSVRTGLAKSHRGGFNITRADDMLAHIINNLMERNPNLPGEAVEDVIMGCGNPEGPMGHNIGRNAAVLSSLPVTVGGTTVNRYCSSGLQTVSMAASQVMAGCYDTVIAGGGLTSNYRAEQHHNWARHLPLTARQLSTLIITTQTFFSNQDIFEI